MGLGWILPSSKLVKLSIVILNLPKDIMITIVGLVVSIIDEDYGVYCCFINETRRR